jgi:hypothetical protein
MATVTVTTDDIGNSIATNGTLTGIVLDTVPTGYREANFTLIDATTGRVWYNADLSTGPVSASSVLLVSGSIPFADLTLQSLPPGASLDIMTT